MIYTAGTGYEESQTTSKILDGQITGIGTPTLIILPDNVMGTILRSRLRKMNEDTAPTVWGIASPLVCVVIRRTYSVQKISSTRMIFFTILHYLHVIEHLIGDISDSHAITHRLV